jgi:hypothetical protein
MAALVPWPGVHLSCRACGGSVCIIAGIEDSAVIEKILTHLDRK